MASGESIQASSASGASATSSRSARPVERRRERHRADARRAILDATQALLVERGYEGLSMRRLASRCGYTAPTIYHHFGDKNGLIDALVEEHCSVLVETLEALPAGGSSVDRLRRVCLAFVEFGLSNAVHYFLLTVPREDDREEPPSAAAARVLFEEPLLRLSSEGQVVGDYETAQQSLWALLHGLITLQWSRPDHDWSDHLTESAIDSIVRGLVRTGSRPTENQP